MCRSWHSGDTAIDDAASGARSVAVIRSWSDTLEVAADATVLDQQTPTTWAPEACVNPLLPETSVALVVAVPTISSRISEVRDTPAEPGTVTALRDMEAPGHPTVLVSTEVAGDSTVNVSTEVPDDPTVSVGIKLLEDVKVPVGIKVPEDLEISVGTEIPEDPGVLFRTIVPEDPIIPVGTEIAEDLTVSVGIETPENPTAPVATEDPTVLVAPTSAGLVLSSGDRLQQSISIKNPLLDGAGEATRPVPLTPTVDRMPARGAEPMTLSALAFTASVDQHRSMGDDDTWTDGTRPRDDFWEEKTDVVEIHTGEVGAMFVNGAETDDTQTPATIDPTADETVELMRCRLVFRRADDSLRLTTSDVVTAGIRRPVPTSESQGAVSSTEGATASAREGSKESGGIQGAVATIGVPEKSVSTEEVPATS